MFLNNVINGADKKAGSYSGSTQSHLIDVWDLLGLILVAGLSIYIWFDQAGAPGPDTLLHSDGDSAAASATNIRSSQSTTTILPAPLGQKQESRSASHRYLDTELADNSGQSRTADKVIERLALLQQRPAWTLTSFDLDNLMKDLDLLVDQGSTAIEAIRQFLRRSLDVDLGAWDGAEKLEPPSLRLALFEVLHRIGGNGVEAIWFEELRATTNPLEIQTLGRYLDEYRPGLYDREILSSAREALSLATAQGNSDRDIAPLFQVFENYGDSSLIPDLEQVPEMWWGRYAAVTLAGLPDGTGLSSLRDRLALDSPRTNLGARFALQLLAQSAEYPEAQVALMDTVHQQQIPDALWREIAWTIAGTYQVQFNNPKAKVKNEPQNTSPAAIYSVNKFISFGPGGNQVLFGVRYAMPQLTREQMAQRLDLIDTLLLETNSPVAQQVLQQAFETIWSAYNEEGKW